MVTVTLFVRTKYSNDPTVQQKKNGEMLMVFLIRIALNVYIALGSIDTLTIFAPLIHEHGMFFQFFVSSSIFS